MDAMNTEHVVVDNKGEIVFRCDTYEQAALWLHKHPDGKRYTIELMDKPSEPKMTDAEVAGMFIDAAKDLSERRRLVGKKNDPSACPHFELRYRDGDNRHDCLQCGARVQVSGSTRRIVGVPETKTNGRNPETVEPRQAHEIAEAALQHVKDRASTYDQSNGERSARQTATAFNAITGENLTESYVWLLFQLLKDVRQWSKEDYHQDSAEDCIAYAALKAESLERKA